MGGLGETGSFFLLRAGRGDEKTAGLICESQEAKEKEGRQGGEKGGMKKAVFFVTIVDSENFSSTRTSPPRRSRNCEGSLCQSRVLAQCQCTQQPSILMFFHYVAGVSPVDKLPCEA